MRKIFLIPMVLLLSGCSGGCLEKVYPIELGILQAYETNEQALISGMIDVDTARKAKLATDTANIASGTAKNLCVLGDPAADDYIIEAVSSLSKAQELLPQLEAIND